MTRAEQTAESFTTWVLCRAAAGKLDAADLRRTLTAALMDAEARGERLASLEVPADPAPAIWSASIAVYTEWDYCQFCQTEFKGDACPVCDAPGNLEPTMMPLTRVFPPSPADPAPPLTGPGGGQEPAAPLNAHVGRRVRCYDGSRDRWRARSTCAGCTSMETRNDD